RPSGRLTTESPATPVGVTPAETTSGFQNERHVLSVQMNVPRLSALRVYSVRPASVTTIVFPSFAFFDVVTTCSRFVAPNEVVTTTTEAIAASARANRM